MSELKKHLTTYDVSALNGMSDYWKGLLFQSFILVLPEQFRSQSPTQQQSMMDIINGKQPTEKVNSHYLNELFIAIRCLMTNDVDGCAVFLEKYESDSQNDVAYLYLYFFYHCTIQEWQEALNTLDKLVKLQPRSALFHAFRGYLNCFARDNNKAMESCRFALQNPTTELEKLKFGRYLPHALFQAEYLLTGKSHSLFDSSCFRPGQSIEEHLAVLAKELPPIQTIFEQDSSFNHSFFVMADANYFKKWAIPLALSAIEAGIKDGLHIHIVNPDPESMHALNSIKNILGKKMSATIEIANIPNICPDKIYYSCVRFCRLAQVMLSDNSKNYTLIDADLLFNKPIDEVMLFKNLHSSYFIQAKDEPLWDHLPAGLCHFDNSDATYYLVNISSFILNSILTKKYAWFLDQVAISITAIQAEREYLQLQLINATDLLDLTHADTSHIWVVTNDKGAEKFLSKKNSLLEKYSVMSKNIMLPPVSLVDAGESRFLLFSGKDLISNHLFRHLQWEKHITDLAVKILKNDPNRQNVIDIGANLGSFTLAVAPHIHGQVHAFEPQRIIFQQLTGNCFLNRRSNIFTYNTALGAPEHSDASIEVPFYEFDKSDNFGATQLGNNKTDGSNIHHYEQVPLKRLDDYNLKQVGLIKIDVEGMEEDVLRGATQTLQHSNYPPVLFEMWTTPEHESKRISLLHRFKNLGYSKIIHLGADDYLAQYATTDSKVKL